MKNRKIKLETFAEVGTKNCESKCKREVLMTKEGPVVICFGCNRIVMDQRNKR
jgi:hypothetical protein